MIAISTAYKEALIGIDIDGKHSFKSMDANCKHSENLLLNIDKMLDEINVSIKDNDTYSVVVGPGSFTGIRIGVSLVKGLIAGSQTKQKIIRLTTFDLMAYSYINQCKPNVEFYCVINALSGLYYVCKFDKNGIKLEEEKVVDTKAFENIKETKVGLLEENIAEILVRPTAEELLQLSEIKAEHGEFIFDNELLPLYLRKSQAECSIEDKK